MLLSNAKEQGCPKSKMNDTEVISFLANGLCLAAVFDIASKAEGPPSL